MECYGTVFFNNKDEDSELITFVKDLAINKHGLHIEGGIIITDGLTSINFMGGSDTDDKLCNILFELNVKKADVVKGYWTGDEDPFVELLWVCKETGKIDSSAISDGIYEMLSDMEPEEIEENTELMEASQKGPKEFFESQFNRWAVGLESQDLEQAQEILESVIDSSKDLVF